MSKSPILLAGLSAALSGALAFAAPALADEIVKTGDGGAPAAAATASDQTIPTTPRARDSDEAIGAWGRRILNGEPSAAEDEPSEAAVSRCAAETGDGKPHGEVWAGIGTRGYREVGGVVSQPLGKCGRLTVMVDKTDGGIGAVSGRPR